MLHTNLTEIVYTSSTARCSKGECPHILFPPNDVEQLTFCMNIHTCLIFPNTHLYHQALDSGLRWLVMSSIFMSPCGVIGVLAAIMDAATLAARAGSGGINKKSLGIRTGPRVKESHSSVGLNESFADLWPLNARSLSLERPWTSDRRRRLNECCPRKLDTCTCSRQCPLAQGGGSMESCPLLDSGSWVSCRGP